MRCGVRRPWLAGMLSTSLTGLGQLYNGRPLAAGVALAVPIVLIIVGGMALMGTFSGLMAMVLAMAVWQIVVIVHAAMQARRVGEIQLRWYHRWPIYLAIWLGAVAGLQIGLSAFASHARFHAYRSPTGGMEDTIRIGDRFIADSWSYRGRLPMRGDIVMFRFPLDPSKDFVKRCIGLPGETVEIRDKRVSVNGVRLDEPYATHTDFRTYSDASAPALLVRRDQLRPYRVLDGTVFLLGDNRDESLDSRFYGAVDAGQLKGRPLYVYWSKDRSRIGRVIR